MCNGENLEKKFSSVPWSWAYFTNWPNAAASIAPTLMRHCLGPYRFCPVAAPGIFSWGGGLKPGHMASARSASLYGGLGAEPPAGLRGRAPGGGQEGEAPLKLKALSLLGGPLMRQICIILRILQSQKTAYILELHTHGIPRDNCFQTPWEFRSICFHPRGNPVTLLPFLMNEDFH